MASKPKWFIGAGILFALVIVAGVPLVLINENNKIDRLDNQLDRNHGKPVATISNSDGLVRGFVLRDCTVNTSGDAEFVSGYNYRNSTWTIHVPKGRNWNAKFLCDILNEDEPTEEEYDMVLGPRKDITLSNYKKFRGYRTCVISEHWKVTLSTIGSDAETFTDPGTIQAEEGFCEFLPGATADIEIIGPRKD